MIHPINEGPTVIKGKRASFAYCYKSHLHNKQATEKKQVEEKYVYYVFIFKNRNDTKTCMFLQILLRRKAKVKLFLNGYI